MRKSLSRKNPGLHFKENAVYAWLPTLTSVSRQALFAGKSPLYFPTSIRSTSREPALWSRFWCDQGLRPSQIGYIKKLGHGGLDKVEGMVADKKLKVAGFVVEKVDKIMHGMQLGTAGMHNQVEQWTGEGYFSKLIALLHKHGFKIWLTSDHGNMEANGCGSPGECMIADIRGVRVRIYPTETLRNQVKLKFPDSIEWLSCGLPDDFVPLLAPHRSAFVEQGRRVVGHGGISLEEVVVPFVEIEWKKYE